MSINQPRVDYFRLATFDYQQFLGILPMLRMRHEGWRPYRWLQYQGQRAKDGTFYAAGQQGGRPHAIIESQGEQAHNFYLWWMNLYEGSTSTFYATRIDVQVTKKPPEGFDYLSAHKRLRKPKQLILGDAGNTLYVGARTSDTFWRVYDKDERGVRVELELKGKQAKRAYATLRQQPSLVSIYNTYLLRSRVPTILVDHYRGQAEAVELVEVNDETDMEKKLEWMATLDGLAYKLANDHDLGERAVRLFRRWSEYGRNLDKS